MLVNKIQDSYPLSPHYKPDANGGLATWEIIVWRRNKYEVDKNRANEDTSTDGGS